MGRAAGFLAEVTGLVRLVLELVALRRALERRRAAPERGGGPGGPGPAEPEEADVPGPEGRGDPAPAS